MLIVQKILSLQKKHRGRIVLLEIDKCYVIMHFDGSCVTFWIIRIPIARMIFTGHLEVTVVV